MNEAVLILRIDAVDGTEKKFSVQLEVQANVAALANKYLDGITEKIAIDDRFTRKLEDFGKCRGNPLSFGNVSSVHSLSQQLEWEELLGIEIYRTFFPGNIGKTFEDFLNLLQQRKIQMLTLIISSPIVWILDIPFEIMQRENELPFSLSHEHFHMARSIDTDSTDFGELKVEPMALPLKMLFVSALPIDLPEEGRLIELEEEQEQLIGAIGELISEQKVVVEFLDITTLEEIEKSLKSGQHQVVHFSGHGGHVDLSSGESGILYLEDEWGRVKAVTGQELARSLKKFPCIRLVVLSACETARADEHGVAGALMRNGIPAVLGMRYPVGDQTATNFTSQFYEYICAGESPGYAMFQARKTIYDFEIEIIKKKQKEDPGSAVVLEWMTPFLYQVQKMDRLINHSKETTDTSYFFQKPESLVKGGKYVGRGFVGRHKELLGLYRLFREGKRCVCIYGQGGTGKTTLSVRFADNFENGAYQIIQFIGEVTEETILTELAKVASKFMGDQIKEIVKSPDYDSTIKLNILLEDFLSQRKIILLFDNFEENQVASVESDEKKVYQREIHSPSLKAFLVHLCKNLKSPSYILFTTRYLFMEPEVASLNLGEMRFSDTFKLINRFKKLLKLSNDQKRQVHQKLGGHPRALELLDRCISHEEIGWESISRKFREVEDEEINHDLLLDMLWEQLNDDEQKALMGASAFRGLTARAGLMAVTGQEEKIIKQSVESLNGLSLLYMEGKRFYTHRLTATFVQISKMNNKMLKDFHVKAADYFAGILNDEGKKDINDVLEARWHYLEGGQGNRAAETTFGIEGYLTLHGYPQLSFELLSEISDKDINEKNRAIVYLSLGILHFDFGDYDQSLKQYEKAMEFYERIGDITGVSDILHNIGMLYENKNDYDQALRQYEKAMEIKKKIGDINGVSNNLHHIGNINYLKGDYKTALRHYKKSMEINKKIGNIKGISSNLHSIGLIYQYKGDYDQALRQYKKAIEISEKIGDIKGISNSLAQIGVIYQYKGDHDHALELYEKAMEIFKNIGNIKGISVILLQKGVIYQNKGDYDQALKQYEKAMEISEKIEDIKGVSNSMGQIGNIYYLKGNYEQASKLYEKSLEIREKIGDIKGVSDNLHQFGMIYQNKGNYDQALKQYEKSLEIREKIGDIEGVSDSLYAIGIIYLNKGDYDQALRQYEKAIENSEKIGDIKGISAGLNAIGVIYQHKGDYDQALKQHKKSIEISKKIEDIKGISLSLHNIGNIYYFKGGYDQALKQYEKSMEIREKIGDIKGISDSLHQIGMIYKDKGDYEQSLKQYEKALEIREKNGDIKGISDSLHQIGITYQYKGDYDRALKQYEKAMEISEKIGDILGTALSLGRMGTLYLETKDYNKALRIFITTFSIFLNLGSNDVNVTISYILKVKKKIPEEQFKEILKEFNLPPNLFDEYYRE